MAQLSLFDNPRSTPAHVSAHVSRVTKAEALERHAPRLCQQSRDVLAAIVAAGETGRTRHEVADELGIPVTSVCGRVKPLLDAGVLFQRPGERRNGRAVLFVNERKAAEL